MNNFNKILELSTPLEKKKANTFDPISMRREAVAIKHVSVHSCTIPVPKRIMNSEPFHSLLTLLMLDTLSIMSEMGYLICLHK